MAKSLVFILILSTHPTNSVDDCATLCIACVCVCVCVYVTAVYFKGSGASSYESGGVQCFIQFSSVGKVGVD